MITSINTLIIEYQCGIGNGINLMGKCKLGIVLHVYMNEQRIHYIYKHVCVCICAMHLFVFMCVYFVISMQ